MLLRSCPKHQSWLIMTRRYPFVSQGMLLLMTSVPSFLTCTPMEVRLISYASRTLTSSEQNYALSLVFGIKRFHQYLYWREFQLLTDHKPLTTILGPKTGIASLAAARLQRLALLLSGYNYLSITWLPSGAHHDAAHGNVDGLSRLPLKSGKVADSVPTSTDGVLTSIRSQPYRCHPK